MKNNTIYKVWLNKMKSKLAKISRTILAAAFLCAIVVSVATSSSVVSAKITANKKTLRRL